MSPFEAMSVRPGRESKVLYRSVLVTPGNNVRMLQKAARSGADAVLVDLEDAVPPLEKARARDEAVSALSEMEWLPPRVGVRLNAATSPWAAVDLEQLIRGAGRVMSYVVLPKVEERSDVEWLVAGLDDYEERAEVTEPIAVQLLIETSRGIQNAPWLVEVDSRIEALVFGSGDLQASQGVRFDLAEAAQQSAVDFWDFARNTVVLAARASGRLAIDGPFVRYMDLDAYRVECSRAGLMGFSGKWAIHPDQVDVANDVFTPTPAEVERAKAIVDAYEHAASGGLGATSHAGMMIDEATVRISANVLDLHEKCLEASRRFHCSSGEGMHETR